MISVVIPAFNVEKTIGACLAALNAQIAPGDEIIVVDDGSTDATRAVAASHHARVIAQTNRGAGAARNIGAQNARGDILLFIDADSIPDPRWIANLTAPFADAGMAGASGEKKSRQKNLWARYVQTEYDWRYERLSSHRVIDFVDSSTAAYRRDIFLAHGGFDTTLSDAEDTELSFRLSERGCRMALARDAIVWHTHPESLGEFLRRKFRYAFWRAIVLSKHPRKVAADTRTPQSQKVQMLIAGALIPVALGAILWNALVWLVVLLALAFIATTLAFTQYAWRRDPVLALIAPGVLLLAAYAGGAGAALGTLRAVTKAAR